MIGWIVYLAIAILLMVVFWIKKDKIKIQPLLFIPFGGKWEKYGIEVEVPKKGSKTEKEKKRGLPILFIIMYKTKIGLRFIDNLIARRNWIKKFLKAFSYFSIGLCILMMIIMFFAFIKYIWIKYFTEAVMPMAGVVVVLPFKTKTQLYVPALYWLISIFVIATVHEFGHAIIARLNNIKVDSTGPAFFCFFLPIIPAAYVEPNEKEMEIAEKKKQIAILSAGPTMNILVGGLALLILIGLAFIIQPLQAQQGILITSIENELKEAGMLEGDIITHISSEGNVYAIPNINQLALVLSSSSPGDMAFVCLERGECYNVALQENPDSPGSVFLGIHAKTKTGLTNETIAKYGRFLPGSLIWITGLFMWLALLNIGIGMFNALPMGIPFPLDGSQMLLYTVKDKKWGKSLFLFISFLFLGLLIASVI